MLKLFRIDMLNICMKSEGEQYHGNGSFPREKYQMREALRAFVRKTNREKIGCKKFFATNKRNKRNGNFALSAENLLLSIELLIQMNICKDVLWAAAATTATTLMVCLQRQGVNMDMFGCVCVRTFYHFLMRFTIRMFRLLLISFQRDFQGLIAWHGMS